MYMYTPGNLRNVHSYTIFIMSLQERNVVWRYPNERTVNYPICYPIDFSDGLLITEFGSLITSNHYQFTHLCENELPVLCATNLLMKETGIDSLPIFEESWYMFLTYEDIATLNYRYGDSIYPIIYALSTASVISVFLTSILFTKHYITSSKPTFLLRLSSFVATCQLVAIYIYAITKLSQQSQKGESASSILMNGISQNLGFNIVYFIVFFLLLLTQVEIIKKIFPRKKEKKVIIISGIILATISQIIWALSTFLSDSDWVDGHYKNASNFGNDDDAMAILPGFMYLLRISLSVLYSSLIQVYSFSKKNFIFSSSILPLTITMFIGVNSSIAFFVADISNVWVSELSEVFNLTSYVIANIVTWEWLSRIYQMEKSKQKDGVLGRQFFEEYNPDELLKAEKPKRFNLKADNYLKWKGKMKGYQAMIHKRHLKRHDTENHNINNSNANKIYDNTNNDVYIYSPKQVVVEPLLKKNHSRMIKIPQNLQNNLIQSRVPLLNAQQIPKQLKNIKKTFPSRKRPVINHKMKTIQTSGSMNDDNDDNDDDYGEEDGDEDGGGNANSHSVLHKLKSVKTQKRSSSTNSRLVAGRSNVHIPVSGGSAGSSEGDYHEDAESFDELIEMRDLNIHDINFDYESEESYGEEDEVDENEHRNGSI